ncbi:MAG: hypothetical protein Kow00127_13770 [Bacteroidales bacterium]
MSKVAHTLYITTFVILVAITMVILIIEGTEYYQLPLEERFFHEQHQQLKPSGSIGHGLGIFGSVAMIIGVGTYMLRKRLRSLSRMGKLQYWLEFHIFLCTLGPLMVLFHTAFKFGGIVSISFWSMVAVFASGVIGRFIYLQIPRSIEGRELTLQEVNALKQDMQTLLKTSYNLEDEITEQVISVAKGNGNHSGMAGQWLNDRKKIRNLKKFLESHRIKRAEIRRITKMVNEELTLNRRISRLQTMQQIFKYWHVAHLPFALIMLVIMIIHVIVTLTFGYRWIF